MATGDKHSRPQTLSMRRIKADAAHQKRAGARQAPLAAHSGRPKTRGECAGVPRPCPHVSCRYNLFLDIKQNGAVKLNRGLNPNAIMDTYASCALDVAADGARSVEYVAQLLNLTRERVRQLEEKALERLQTVGQNANLAPGQLQMLEEGYTQAPASEALDQLNLGADKEWLTKVCNRMDVHGEKWTL